MSKVFNAHAVSVDGYISDRTADGDEEFGRGLGDVHLRLLEVIPAPGVTHLHYEGDPMILITGGLGMIGAHSARALADLGQEVVVAAHRQTGVPSFLAGRVSVEPLDVTDRDAFFALAGRYDISDIIHLAGSIPGEDPVGFFRTDTTGLLNALDAARTWGVRRFAVASSIGVYIGRTETRWHEELALPAADLPRLIVAFKKAVEPLTTHSFQGSGVQPVVLGSGPSGDLSSTQNHRSCTSRPRVKPCR